MKKRMASDKSTIMKQLGAYKHAVGEGETNSRYGAYTRAICKLTKRLHILWRVIKSSTGYDSHTTEQGLYVQSENFPSNESNRSNAFQYSWDTKPFLNPATNTFWHAT